MAAESYTSVIQQMFPELTDSEASLPKTYSNLKQPFEYESVTIELMGPDGSARESFQLDSLYPFHTVRDCMTLIYNEKGGDDTYHPNLLCLMIPTESGELQPLHVQHKKVSSRGSEILTLIDPFTQVDESTEPNENFVDLAGSRNTRLESSSLADVLLETVLFREGQTDYTIQCYVYSDVLAQFTGARRPISSRDWIGRFEPYFPLLARANEDGTLPDEILSASPKLIERTLTRLALITELDGYLQSNPLEHTPELRNFRYLRFAWTPLQEESKLYEPFRLESLFYEMPVTELVPYIRFWPKANTPLSKVHVQPYTNIPSLEKPEVLLEWTGKKTLTLTPEEDCLMAKILVRKGYGTENPLYATLYMFEDGSAKLILQPNRDQSGQSRITLRELETFGDTLDKVFATIPLLQPTAGAGVSPVSPFLPSQFSLEDCHTLLELNYEKGKLDEEWFKNRLPFFSAFFQLTTSPIKEMNPIVFLRYKLMDNFRIPSRDFQFLHRALDLLKFSDERGPRAEKRAKKEAFDQLVEFYSREYTVSEEVAKARVLAYYKEQTDIEKIVAKDTTTFKLRTNPGLDISLFGTAPRYVFHLYRINSGIALMRIKTLLALLCSVDVFSVFPEEALASAEKLIQRPDAVEQRDADARAREDREEAEGEGEGEENLGSALRAGLLAENALGEGDEAAAAGLGFVGDELGDEFGLGGFGDEEEAGAGAAGASGAAAAARAPSPSLEDLAREDAEEEGEEPVGKLADEDDAELLITEASQLKYLTPAKYFGQRLLFYDRKLFSWSTKGSTSLKGYPGMCASNALKQPTVLTKEEYEAMKKVYATEEAEGRVQWLDYPKEKAKPFPNPVKTRPDIKTEQITVLRYGSDLAIDEANYYICSTYWCIRDSRVILEEDFEKAWDHTSSKEADVQWRAAHPLKLPRKGKQQCPFCGGGPVLKEHRKKHIESETVIERIKQKSGKQKRHTYIGFLTKKGLHPNGYYLPCCFTKDPDKENALLLERHPAFEPQRRIAPKPISAVNPADVVNRGIVREEIGIGQAPRGSAAATADPEILYKKRLKEIHSIILVDKSNELEILRDGTPNIGICQDVLDRYFAQRSKLDLVKRPGGVYRLMTNENDETSMAGFFRIAADNRIEKKADSFLNALTPYFGYSSPQQFKQKLQDLMKPPVFLQLNYGNTLFDFYSKSIKDPPNIEKRITAFARTIKMPLTQTIKAPGAEGENEAAAKLYTDTLVRAFKGYQAFEKHFNDNRIIKEYRIFGQFFTNAGFMDATPDGILFVVLELDSKNEIRVRCPPFGVSAEAAERCDYAFLLHYVDTNLWEPLFYTEHNPDAEEPHKSYFIFRQEDKENWPEIVKRRVREFNRLCRSSGLGIYTQIEKGKEITPLLLTLSEARDLATPVELKMTTPADQRITIKYVLRDLYNHINGVVITTKGKLIVVPCVDDGTLLDKENAYDVQLDFRNTIPDLAGFQETRAWYTKFMGPHLTKIGGPLLEKRKALYTIQETAYGEQEEDAAFQSFQIPVAKLGAPGVDYGLFIPVAKTEGVPVTPYTMIPWLVDAQILFGTADPSAKLDVSFTEFQEIYEHLRYTFSNWFSVADPDLRKEVTEILFDAGDGYTINRSYPYWRKRLLLEDAIGGEVRKWLTTDPVSKTVTTFKRVDCRVQKEDTCHTRCVWKGEQGCLLHVPNDPFLLGKTSVRAEDLLVKKLIDELIHYPLQQAELLQKRVYSYQKLKDFVRTDTQYITPESVPSWEEFLRMDWRIQEPEKKKHYEEFTAILEPSEDDLGAAPPLSPAAEGEGEGEGENDEGAASPDSNEGEDEAAVPVAAPAPAAAAAAEEEDEDEEEEEDAPRELGRPPAKVVEKFGPNFYWFPFTDEYSLWTHFTTSPLGFEEEELTAAGQVNEDRSMTLETMKLLASKRGESVFQYDAIAPSEADRNLVVWVKTAAGLKKDFLVHYVDEEHSGFLSASNQADDFSSILFSKLKAPFPSIIAKNKTILVEV